MVALLNALPGESAYKTAVRDAIPDEDLAVLAEQQDAEGHGPWSRLELLAAALIDLAKWQIYATYAAQGGKPQEPEPLRRPGVAKRRDRRANPTIRADLRAEIRAIAEEHARLHGYSL